MAVSLRLYRLGKKGHPAYRIVAVDRKAKRNGSYIEAVGFYDPMKQSDQVNINSERLNYWKEKGAHISEGLQKLLKFIKPKTIKPKKG